MRKALMLALLAAASLLLAGQALAARQVHAAKTVTVVMHDPGCHWFSVGGKFLKKLTVTGPVELKNFDEAALDVAGPGGVKQDKVGKELALGRGVYHITMVGQAPDDNHLTLVVK